MSLTGLGTLEQELALLVEVSEGFVSGKYLFLASFIALIYDHLTSLDDEVRSVPGVRVRVD